jgi:hypothetical protein
MKPPEFTISANDSTLAHAAAFGRIKQLRGDTKRLFDKVHDLDGKTSVRDGAKLVEAHFGKLIVFTDIDRLRGSRPRARWMALDANVDGGSDMVAILISVDSHGWSVRDLSIRLAAHTVARLMQRTTKHSSLQRFGAVLRDHILAVLPKASELEDGYTLTTATGAGALIWIPHDDGVRGVRGVTWLGAETIVDPYIATMCHTAADTKIGIHIEKMNGDAIWTRKSAETVDGTMPTALLLSEQAGRTA